MTDGWWWVLGCAAAVVFIWVFVFALCQAAGTGEWRKDGYGDASTLDGFPHDSYGGRG